MLTTAQAAEVTGYHHETIGRWCGKKELEFFYIRRSYLIPKTSLIKYLTENCCHAINDTAKEHILMAVKQFDESSPTFSQKT